MTERQGIESGRARWCSAVKGQQIGTGAAVVIRLFTQGTHPTTPLRSRTSIVQAQSLIGHDRFRHTLKINAIVAQIMNNKLTRDEWRRSCGRGKANWKLKGKQSTRPYFGIRRLRSIRPHQNVISISFTTVIISFNRIVVNAQGSVRIGSVGGGKQQSTDGRR